jgi:hypothetical protein
MPDRIPESLDQFSTDLIVAIGLGDEQQAAAVGFERQRERLWRSILCRVPEFYVIDLSLAA